MNEWSLIDVEVCRIVLGGVEAVVGVLKATVGCAGVDGAVVARGERRSGAEDNLAHTTLTDDVDLKHGGAGRVNAADAELELLVLGQHDAATVRRDPRFNSNLTAKSVADSAGYPCTLRRGADDVRSATVAVSSVSAQFTEDTLRDDDSVAHAIKEEGVV
jgi:hypothetical protein